MILQATVWRIQEIFSHTTGEFSRGDCAARNATHNAKFLWRLKAASPLSRNLWWEQQARQPLSALPVEARAAWEACEEQVQKQIEVATAERDRLLRGDFTKEEIHGIRHNLHNTVSAEEFAAGCATEQRKLYGRAPDVEQRDELRKLTAPRCGCGDGFVDAGDLCVNCVTRLQCEMDHLRLLCSSQEGKVRMYRHLLDMKTERAPTARRITRENSEHDLATMLQVLRWLAGDLTVDSLCWAFGLPEVQAVASRISKKDEALRLTEWALSVDEPVAVDGSLLHQTLAAVRAALADSAKSD